MKPNIYAFVLIPKKSKHCDVLLYYLQRPLHWEFEGLVSHWHKEGNKAKLQFDCGQKWELNLVVRKLTCFRLQYKAYNSKLHLVNWKTAKTEKHGGRLGDQRL